MQLPLKITMSRNIPSISIQEMPRPLLHIQCVCRRPLFLAQRSSSDNPITIHQFNPTTYVQPLHIPNRLLDKVGTLPRSTDSLTMPNRFPNPVDDSTLVHEFVDVFPTRDIYRIKKRASRAFEVVIWCDLFAAEAFDRLLPWPNTINKRSRIPQNPLNSLNLPIIKPIIHNDSHSPTRNRWGQSLRLGREIKLTQSLNLKSMILPPLLRRRRRPNFLCNSLRQIQANIR